MTVVTVSTGAVTDVATADTRTLDTDTAVTGTLVTGTSDAPGTGDLGGPVPTDARHARALAALRSAEVRTGVRRQAPAPARESPHETSRRSSHEPSRVQVRALPGGLANGSANGSAHTSVDALAEVSTASTVRPAPSSGSRMGSPDGDARVLPVHPHLVALLPDGGLRTGTTVVVRGSTSLLLALLAEASSDGAWTVLVGYPAAGMAAAADAGCDLTRTLVVPLPAGWCVDAPAVLAALIDGMDVVVVGPEVALLDQDRRRLTSRARERGTVLVAAPPPAPQREGGGGWAGAHVVLEATAGGWAGTDQGAGWLRRRTLRVRRTGRGSASRPLHLDVEVPVCGAAATGGAELAGGAEPVAGPGGPGGHGSEGRPWLGLVG